MHAPAFYCPACGGPQQRGGPGTCDFCGAPRLPLDQPDPRTSHPCLECASSVASNHRFCPSCGAVQGENDPALGVTELACPGCDAKLSVWPLDSRLAGSNQYRGSDPQIHGCHTCGGAWVDRQTLDTILREARAHSINVDARSVPRRTMAMAEVVVYRPCPRCRERMHRRNFGRYSGIVIDECAKCGSYFDAGELEGVVAFVRAGGLGLTKQRDEDEAQREQTHRRQMNMPTGLAAPAERFGGNGNLWTSEVDLLVGFLRWVGRWIRARSRTRPRGR